MIETPNYICYENIDRLVSYCMKKPHITTKYVALKFYKRR